jgi:hypothetical protein
MAEKAPGESVAGWGKMVADRIVGILGLGVDGGLEGVDNLVGALGFLVARMGLMEYREVWLSKLPLTTDEEANKKQIQLANSMRPY